MHEYTVTFTLTDKQQAAFDAVSRKVDAYRAANGFMHTVSRNERFHALILLRVEEEMNSLIDSALNDAVDLWCDYDSVTDEGTEA